MKSITSIIAIGTAVVLCTLSTSIRAESPPNIVLIISDDQGFPDYGFMGSKQVKTPNIDRIASQSLLYTRGYATPLCSPSLATLLTGLHARENGITGNDLEGKKGDRKTLLNRLLANPLVMPKALSDAGYRTMQTGKLWNATYRDVGFTHGMTDTAGRHGDKGLDIGRKGMKPAFDFIDESIAEKKPFFLWYAPMMPHTPHTPPPDILKKYTGKGPNATAEAYFAMVEWFDNTCGELDAYLTKKGIADNTVVIYLADNGWEAATGLASKRSKLTPFELGIRTPIFVRWPGRIKPQRDDETLASVIDVVPTILAAAGLKSPAALPGLNLADHNALKARKTISVTAYTHNIADLNDPSKSVMATVVIDGWHKLIVPGPAKPSRGHENAPRSPQLFDLKNDPMETKDIASLHPDEVSRLTALLPPAKR